MAVANTEARMLTILFPIRIELIKSFLLSMRLRKAASQQAPEPPPPKKT